MQRSEVCADVATGALRERQQPAAHGRWHTSFGLPQTRSRERAEQEPMMTFHIRYRERFGIDPEFIEADRIRDESGCVRRYERAFLRPLLPLAG
jgi:hypothetical protein